jgi:glycosyltransferase involved in cell wall biosynthesis
MRSVDVVVPCYNYARYLQACVRSALSQPALDVRVLVIDDCSSDDTPAVGQALAAADARVEYRRHEVNRGHIATYNEGLIGWSTADYVVLLSADDLLAPGSLVRAAAIMESDHRVGMVYGRALHFRCERDIPQVRSGQWRHRRWRGREWIERMARRGHNVISSPEVMVRGSVQREVGGYRPELPHTGDLEMWLRVAMVCDIAHVRGPPQAFYRVHTASMLRTRYHDKLIDLAQRKAAFDAFFADAADRIAGTPRLQALANRALAREALWEACRAYDRDEVESASAAELVKFALDAYPGARLEREFAALARRRRLGPALCSRTQLFAFPAIVRRVLHVLERERWRRQGI